MPKFLSSTTGTLTRRQFTGLALCAATQLVAGDLASPPARRWRLGLNTYCLRFQRWNDRQLFEYVAQQKLDAIFLQDSLDAGRMDVKHWAEVRAWPKDLGLQIETGGGALLPLTPEAYQSLHKFVHNFD